MNSSMSLRILLPSRVFADAVGVSRIVVETPEGSIGLLPNRRDCIGAVAPGILVYEVPGDGEVFVAVDEGVVVKTGQIVLVSVRGAIAGSDLSKLRERVEKDFLELDDLERHARSASARLELGFLNRFAGMKHG